MSVEHLHAIMWLRCPGMPKRKIEECAARQQAQIDSGRQAIVGVNKYVDDCGGEEVDVRIIDNTAVLQRQVAGLQVRRSSCLSVRLPCLSVCIGRWRGSRFVKPVVCLYVFPVCPSASAGGGAPRV
jgi:Methylmalonyl-CoA mutase